MKVLVKVIVALCFYFLTYLRLHREAVGGKSRSRVSNQKAGAVQEERIS